WVASAWGADAIIESGSSKNDHLQVAIRKLSSARAPIPRRQLITSPGWHKFPDLGWTFITATGGIREPALAVDFGSPVLMRYAIPPRPVNLVSAMQKSLAFLGLAPLNITVPVWAAMYRAPLAEWLPLDFTLWITGRSGVRKSSLMAVPLNHFGAFERLTLPETWGSTPNAIAEVLHRAKDVPLVVD